MHADSNRYFAASILRYMGDCRALQEQLHQILTQMSGFTLLLLTRRVGSSLCAGPLDIADQRMKAVRQQFRALKPVGDAAHHFHHLGEATDAIERCIGIGNRCLTAGSDEKDRDDLTRMLRLALEHLRSTARLLPGFEMVDLRQACCAAHAGPANSEFVAAIA